MRGYGRKVVARDAGYRDYAHAEEVAPSQEGEIVVRKIEE
jgi:hypothetical protein